MSSRAKMLLAAAFVVASLIAWQRLRERRAAPIQDADAYVAPDAGDLIRGGAGLRKLRWSAQGRGKRGGARVI